MLKRISACLFTFVFLAIAIIPCYAQVVSENAGEADVSTEVTSEAAAVENDEAAESAVEEKKPSASITSGVPTPVETAVAVEKADEEILIQKQEVKKMTVIDKLVDSFSKTFIKDNRWKLFVEGFGNTLLIALCSTLLGVFIGMVIAIVKVLHAQIDRPNIIINILNFVFNLYTTVIRGTPAVVQLFIAYYIIFKNTDNYILVSIFAFGINSGAYVSEIVRGGIVSIDRGQLEAGRSLGLSYITTMINIVLPQAIKNILPALGNEFILLLKDTSIAGYIGTLELMKAGNIVRSRTFEPYFSLLSVALIYLICVIGLEQLIKYFERRMAKSDRH